MADSPIAVERHNPALQLPLLPTWSSSARLSRWALFWLFLLLGLSLADYTTRALE